MVAIERSNDPNPNLQQRHIEKSTNCEPSLRAILKKGISFKRYPELKYMATTLDREDFPLGLKMAYLGFLIWHDDPELVGPIAQAMELTRERLGRCQDMVYQAEDHEPRYDAILTTFTEACKSERAKLEIKAAVAVRTKPQRSRITGAARISLTHHVKAARAEDPKRTNAEIAVLVGKILDYPDLTERQVSSVITHLFKEGAPRKILTPEQSKTLTRFVAEYRKLHPKASDKEIAKPATDFMQLGRPISHRTVEAINRKLHPAGEVSPRRRKAKEIIIFDRQVAKQRRNNLTDQEIAKKLNVPEYMVKDATTRGIANGTIVPRRTPRQNRAAFKAFVDQYMELYPQGDVPLNLARAAKTVQITRTYANKLYKELATQQPVPPIRGSKR